MRSPKQRPHSDQICTVQYGQLPARSSDLSRGRLAANWRPIGRGAKAVVGQPTRPSAFAPVSLWVAWPAAEAMLSRARRARCSSVGSAMPGWCCVPPVWPGASPITAGTCPAPCRHTVRFEVKRAGQVPAVIAPDQAIPEGHSTPRADRATARSRNPAPHRNTRSVTDPPHQLACSKPQPRQTTSPPQRLPAQPTRKLSDSHPNATTSLSLHYRTNLPHLIF